MTITPDPLAPVSGQFALTGTTGTPPVAEPSSARPWGLRHAVPATGGRTLPEWAYDEVRQVAVEKATWQPLIVAGDPTANTTHSKDGEDPPSSEDWHND